jgi:hypothetical protein
MRDGNADIEPVSYAHLSYLPHLKYADDDCLLLIVIEERAQGKKRELLHAGVRSSRAPLHSASHFRHSPPGDIMGPDIRNEGWAMPMKNNRRRLIIIGGSVAAAACTGCCVLALVASGIASRSGTGGLRVDVCAGLVTSPRLQVGVAWYSPLASYRGPLTASPYAVCTGIPVSSMPTRLYGEWMFPP